LADEADTAGTGQRLSERRIESDARNHRPQAIRPNDSHLGAARPLQNLFLQLRTLCADLLESGGNDDGSLDSRFNAFGDHPRHRGGRRANNGQIDRSWDLADAGIGRDIEDASPFRIHGINVALKRFVLEVFHQGAPNAAGRFGRTNKGYGFWGQHYIENGTPLPNNVIGAFGCGRKSGGHKSSQWLRFLEKT
jgi:hypothetical protein